MTTACSTGWRCYSARGKWDLPWMKCANSFLGFVPTCRFPSGGKSFPRENWQSLAPWRRRSRPCNCYSRACQKSVTAMSLTNAARASFKACAAITRLHVVPETRCRSDSDDIFTQTSTAELFCRTSHAQHHLCAILQLDISLVRHNVNAFGAIAKLEIGQAKYSIGRGNNYSIGDAVLVTQKNWHGAHTVHGVPQLSLHGKVIEVGAVGCNAALRRQRLDEGGIFELKFAAIFGDDLMEREQQASLRIIFGRDFQINHLAHDLGLTRNNDLAVIDQVLRHPPNDLLIGLQFLRIKDSRYVNTYGCTAAGLIAGFPGTWRI